MPTRTVVTRLVAQVGPYTAGMARASAATRAFASTATTSAASASRGVTTGLAATSAAASRQGTATGLRYSEGLNRSLRTAGAGSAARVGASLRATAAPAAAAGRRAGTAYSEALAARVRTGTAAAGAIMRKVGLGAAVGIGALFAVTIGAGFKRIAEIDAARKKLEGLGHSAKEVDTIMGNALASVKGTAFGLDEAATVSAQVVASGIKPGKELEQVLGTVADTATIAGDSMSDMGAIFGKVAARGKVATIDLRQLAVHGVPALQFLAKHYHITAAAAQDMVTAGQVDFKNFEAAMRENLGGAAKKSGDTIIGAFKNLKASLARIGADLMSGFSDNLAPGIMKVTDKLGAVEDKAKAVGKAIGDGLSLAATVGGTALHGLTAVVVPLAKGFGALPGPVKSAALGLGALALANRLFGSKLAGTGAGITRFVGGIRTLGTASSGTVRVVDGVTRSVGAAGTAIGRMTNGTMVRRVGGLTVTMGRFGTAVQQIGERSPAIGRMQGAFLNAAAGAQRFGRTAGIAAAAASGIGSAARGLVGFLGGPWGLALAGATLVLGLWAKKHQEAQQAAAEDRAEVDQLTDSLDKNTGAYTRSTREIVARSLVDKDVAKAAHTLGISMGDLTSAALGQEGPLKRVNATLDAYGKVISTGSGVVLPPYIKEVNKVRDALGREATNASDSKEKHKALAEAMQGTADKTGAAGDAARRATAPATAYKDALSDLKTKTKEAKDAQKELADSIDGVLNGFLSARGDERAYERAIIAARKAAKENGRTLSSKTEKGLENQDVLDQVASTGLKQLQNMRTAGASGPAMRSFIAGLRRQIIDTFLLFNNNVKDAKDYADGVLTDVSSKLAGKISADAAKVKAQVQVARGAVQDLGVDFDTLPKSVQTKIIESGGKNVRGILKGIGIDAGQLNNTPVAVKTSAPGAIAAKGSLGDLAVTAVTVDGTVVQIPVKTPGDADALAALLNLKGAALDAGKQHVSIPSKTPQAEVARLHLLGIRDAAVSADKKHVVIPTRAANVAGTLADIKRVHDAAQDKTVYITFRSVDLVKNPTLGKPRVGPTLPGNAAGGAVYGPGTGTSDSIVRRLSNGEHVWTAAEVAKLGGQDAMYALRAMVRTGGFRIPGHAGGGAVTASPVQVRVATGGGRPLRLSAQDRDLLARAGGTTHHAPVNIGTVISADVPAIEAEAQRRQFLAGAGTRKAS